MSFVNARELKVILSILWIMVVLRVKMKNDIVVISWESIISRQDNANLISSGWQIIMAWIISWKYTQLDAVIQSIIHSKNFIRMLVQWTICIMRVKHILEDFHGVQSKVTIAGYMILISCMGIIYIELAVAWITVCGGQQRA